MIHQNVSPPFRTHNNFLLLEDSFIVIGEQNKLAVNVNIHIFPYSPVEEEYYYESYVIKQDYLK